MAPASRISFKSLGCLAVLGLGLAACGAPPQRSAPVTAPLAAAPAAASPQAPAAALSPLDMRAPDQGLAAAAPPELTADMLHGLTAAQLERSFGPPDFRRLDAPAQLWQYRRPGCRLDVFLYADGAEPPTFAVAHVAAEGPTVARIALGACLIQALEKPAS